jgi:hypothetical protein
MKEISAKELIKLDSRVQAMQGQKLSLRTYRINGSDACASSNVHKVCVDPDGIDWHAAYFCDLEDAHEYVHLMQNVLPAILAELMALRAGVLDGEKPGFFARLRRLFGRGH